MSRTHALAAAGLILGAGGTASADVVIDWNKVWLDTIRATGGGPCPISRAGAMLHVAIFDAVNSIDRQYQPYVGFIETNAPADIAAAAAQAAHDVLVHLYP